MSIFSRCAFLLLYIYIIGAILHSVWFAGLVFSKHLIIHLDPGQKLAEKDVRPCLLVPGTADRWLG